MAVAIVTVVYWKAKCGVLWRIFAWGALAWVVGVAVKIVAAIPNQTIIGGYPRGVAKVRCRAVPMAVYRPVDWRL